MNTEDYLAISGLEHFSFCRRQWALIYIEGLWADNGLTAEGNLLHAHAHDASQRDSRVNKIITRAMPVCSHEMKVSGVCDVVEFNRSESGVSLHGKEGLWQPYPIEYKHGTCKHIEAASLQLCCQAMCLEEMLCCRIPEGAVFCGGSKRRSVVAFTDTLRTQVISAVGEMHQYFDRCYTPKVKPKKGCNSCSLRDLCLPELVKSKSVSEYLSSVMVKDINVD